MSNLYSSIGDLRFYNYFSSTYFAGVPNATIQTNNDKGLVDWIAESAFAALDVARSSLILSWRFPKIVGTPTEPETITAQVTTNNTMSVARFGYRFSNNYSHAVGSNNTGSGLGIRSGEGATISMTSNSNINYLVYPYFLNTSTSATFYVDTQPLLVNRITFAVKSPTTMVFAEFWLNSQTYELLSNPHSCSIMVHGWMHDHNTQVFNSTSQQRGYAFSVGTNTSNNLRGIYQGNRLVTGTTSQPLNVRYYQITCPAYQEQDLFLTDLILYDSTTGYGNTVQLGKVDNRVVCLGRGNFRPGLIYRVNNVFGRTGVEYWICACSYMIGDNRPITYSDLSLPKEIFINNDFSNPKDRDYLMFRVNLRFDLP